MSHFSVIVVGEDFEEQLAPYHEYECTGQNDQYVQDIDMTEDAKEAYARNTCERFKDPEGNLHEPWDARFYRDPLPGEKVGMGNGCGYGLNWDSRDWGDGRGFRTKVRQLPEGWEEVDVPYSEVESFVDFVKGWYGIEAATEETLDTNGEHKYGYVLLDSEGNALKVVDRTNPNAKWDWYTTGPGSRFEHRLLHKKGFKTDQILKGDVDFEKMRDEAGKEAAQRWQITRDALCAADAPLWESWEVILERNAGNIDATRDEYNSQPGMKAVQKELWAMGYYGETDAYLADLDKYVQNARNKACVPFAILKDGQWYERGRMGWWACVSDEDDDWDAKAIEMLEALPDDTVLTVVDCHI